MASPFCFQAAECFNAIYFPYISSIKVAPSKQYNILQKAYVCLVKKYCCPLKRHDKTYSNEEYKERMQRTEIENVKKKSAISKWFLHYMFSVMALPRT